MSDDIIISKMIYQTSFLKLSYYLNIKWVISSTNLKILTNFHHDRFIFERRRPLLKQCIMGSVSSTSIMDFHKPQTVHSFLSVTTWCFLTNLVSIWRLLSPCWSTYIIAWYMLIYYNETSCVREECIIHEGPFWSRDDDRRITLERALLELICIFVDATLAPSHCGGKLWH